MFPFSHPIPLFSLHPPFPFINLVKSLRVPTRLHCSHPLFSTCTMASIALTPFFLFIFIGFHSCSCASFATFAYDFIVLAMPPFFLLSTKFFFFYLMSSFYPFHVLIFFSIHFPVSRSINVHFVASIDNFLIEIPFKLLFVVITFISDKSKSETFLSNEQITDFTPSAEDI